MVLGDDDHNIGIVGDEMITWRNERRKVDDLIPADYNPRKMNDRQRVDLKASLEQFNLADPIIINANGNIIGGHQRLTLLKLQGVDEVDVRVPDRQLNEKEEKELNLRLNKNTGDFDLGMLSKFDPAMLTGVGFDGDMVDSLFELNNVEDNFDAQKAYDAIEKPITMRGDVYEFEGGHRLMCGSSTEFADVEKLMGGGKADLIYTDPPYNVDYKSSSGNGYSSGKFESKKIFNDNLEDGAFIDFLRDAFLNAFAFSHEHANVYCWFAMNNYSQFRCAIESTGFRYMQTILWMKERFVLSMGWYYHRITEPCMIFYKDWNKKFLHYGYAKNHDMWSIDKLTFEESLDIWFQHRDANKDYQHPTQKPVRLGERALKKNSEVGHIVLDLFGGSGSTLLCAHQLKRKCYSMELDPKFCDVIVGRFEALTGTKAKRI